MNDKISEDELYILSFYRASELAGGLLLGKVAMHTDIDELRAPLTKHAAEEVEHGWLWTKAINDLGYEPLKVTRTYQTEYGRAFGMPTTMIEILGLTQVLELRVMEHFNLHLEKENLHPIIKSTLERMIEDEKGHLSWVKVRLDEYAEKGHQAELDDLMKRLHEVDEKAYAKLAQEEQFANFFKE